MSTRRMFYVRPRFRQLPWAGNMPHHRPMKATKPEPELAAVPPPAPILPPRKHTSHKHTDSMFSLFNGFLGNICSDDIILLLLILLLIGENTDELLIIILGYILISEKI